MGPGPCPGQGLTPVGESLFGIYWSKIICRMEASMARAKKQKPDKEVDTAEFIKQLSKQDVKRNGLRRRLAYTGRRE